MMNKTAAAMAVLLMLSAVLPARAQQPDPVDAFFQEYDAQPDQLRRFLFAYGYDPGTDESLKYSVDQTLATDFAFMGRPNDADRTMPFFEELPDGYTMPDRSHYTAVPALDRIVRKAMHRQVVMVNEAHHRPETRLLTLALLPRLRALGFTHLALETLYASDTTLAARGYPLYGISGYYSAEPLYGDIIREALRLGFVLVPYESAGIPGQTQQQRETRQAQNLISRIFDADPGAKVLVHAGYSHVDKAVGGFGLTTRPMAMEFQRLSGIEPLSIEQAIMPPAPPGEPPSLADRLATTFRIARPSVLVANAGHREWALFPDRNDMSVVFPRVNYATVRPTWLSLDGRRAAAPMMDDLRACRGRLPCAIEARYAGESDDAVPADQFVALTPADRRLALYLRPGRYRLVVRDDAARVVSRRSVHVR